MSKKSKEKNKQITQTWKGRNKKRETTHMLKCSEWVNEKKVTKEEDKQKQKQENKRKSKKPTETKNTHSHANKSSYYTGYEERKPKQNWNRQQKKNKNKRLYTS